MKLERLGWVVAAALAGGMVGMGFKAPGDKTGSVDIAKIFKESDFSKKQTEALRGQIMARQAVIEFVKNNRNMKADDATKLRDLSIKDTQSAADKTDIERIKSDAISE